MTVGEEELVREAYGLVMSPQRYNALLETMGARVFAVSVPEGDADMPGARIRAAFGPVAGHFAEAMSLMRARGRPTEGDRFSRLGIDNDSHPALLIGADGVVQHANAAARAIFGFRNGSRPEAERFEYGGDRDLMRDLSRLSRFPWHEVVAIYTLYGLNDGEPIRMALTRVENGSGESVGHLGVVRIRWTREAGRRFADMFGLSDAELAITRAVVSGKPLTDVARTRKRALGTVRQQLKALLSRLQIHSQGELASLYAGVSRYRIGLFGGVDAGPFAGDPGKSLALSGGRNQHYMEYGPEGGSPAIFFPPLTGGAAVPHSVRRLLADRNVRLLCPFRPGMGWTDPDPCEPHEGFARFADDVAELLDHEGVNKAPLLAGMSASPFAYAMAGRHPGRIERLVTINPTLPNVRGSHLECLDPEERLRNELFRHLPVVGEFLIHGGLAKIESGHDLDFLLAMVHDHGPDPEISQHPDMLDQLRRGFCQVIEQGYDGFTRDLILAATDWEHLLDTIEVPTVNLVGRHNRFFDARVAQAFARERHGFDVSEVIDGGHLLLYQQPELIFDHLFGDDEPTAAAPTESGRAPA